MTRYDAERLHKLSVTQGFLNAAFANLKRAHAYAPETSGDLRKQLHALAKLVDSERMRTFDRISKHIKATTAEPPKDNA